MGYLDDTFLIEDTFNECKNSVLASGKLITNLGFFIHPEKSKLFPSQVIEFLGFIINSKKTTLSYSESKQNDIKATLKEVKIKGKVVIRTLAKLIGKLEAALPGIQHGRLYLWHLHQSKNTALKKARGNFDSMCILDNNAQIELQWWEHNINTFNIIDQNVLPNIEIFSDACLTGWGAAYNRHSTGGHWSVEESKSHINFIFSAYLPLIYLHQE